MNMNRLIFIWLLLAPFCSTAFADSVFLNDGRIIKTKEAWEEGDQIKCYMYGSIVGFSKDTVTKVEHDEISETDTETANDKSEEKEKADETVPTMTETEILSNFESASENEKANEKVPTTTQIEKRLNVESTSEKQSDPKGIFFRKDSRVFFNNGSDECHLTVVWFSGLDDDVIFCRKAGEIIQYPISDIDMARTMGETDQEKCPRGGNFFVSAMEETSTVSFLDSMEGIAERKLIVEYIQHDAKPDEKYRYRVNGEVRFSKNKPASGLGASLINGFDAPYEIWEYWRGENHMEINSLTQQKRLVKPRHYRRMLLNPDTKEYEKPSFKATRARLREIGEEIQKISAERRKHTKELDRIEARIRNAEEELTRVIDRIKYCEKLKEDKMRDQTKLSEDIRILKLEQTKILEDTRILKSSYEETMNNPINRKFEELLTEADGYCTGKLDLICPFENCKEE